MYYTDGNAATAIGTYKGAAMQSYQRSVKLMTPTRKKLLASVASFFGAKITVIV
jgi:hypothetical protein